MIRPSVTIGIPAFNEEKNIAWLLNRLVSQNQQNWSLDRIIVYSDGSWDATCQLVKEFDHPLVNLISSKDRKGLAHAVNKIISLTASDILVLIDGDVLPANHQMVNFLVYSFNNHLVGLVSGRKFPAPPYNRFEATIAYSQLLHLELKEELPPDRQLYLCHGPLMAFSRRLYKKLKFPPIRALDAFSYLSCLKLGLSFRYQQRATVIYKVPDNFRDYFNQSSRFLKARKELYPYFDPSIIDYQYATPAMLAITTVLKGMAENPYKTSAYLAINFFSRLLSIWSRWNPGKPLWTPAGSSKQLNPHLI
ncbi:glycosyltransferase [Candidatus Collierbacteria bacterium]|nr:glycosyltransferase [Candidatus Collierbacteria bacterium]